MEQRLCDQCKDGKTTGEVFKVYGYIRYVLCEYHRRLLLSSLCNEPGVKEAHQKLARIIPSKREAGRRSEGSGGRVTFYRGQESRSFQPEMSCLDTTDILDCSGLVTSSAPK